MRKCVLGPTRAGGPAETRSSGLANDRNGLRNREHPPPLYDAAAAPQSIAAQNELMIVIPGEVSPSRFGRIATDSSRLMARVTNFAGFSRPARIICSIAG